MTPLQAQQPPRHGLKKKLTEASLAFYGEKGATVHFLCTATVFRKVADGYLLLTAGHCVIGNPDGVIYSVAEKIEGPRQFVDVLKARDDDDKPLDFAVLKLKTTKHYPVIPLGDERVAHVGDKILDVHFSEGIIQQVSEGRIASGIMTPSPKHTMGIGRFMVQMYAGSGSSGSAVVYKGRIIGIVRGGYDANIGGAITPISGFAEFMSLPNQYEWQPVNPND